MMRLIPALTLSVLLAPATLAAGPDILIADFEGDDYGDWTVTGEAFGPGPARGTLERQKQVSGYLGKGLVDSYYHGDGTTGTLTSSPLRIERTYINFLIGGGMHPGQTCINLVVDGKIVRTATGPNDRPGGSERLDWHSWDVSDLAGKQAVLQIVDQATGGWGHINIDHIVQSDRKRQLDPARRQVLIERRYLHLPVTNGAAKRRVRYLIDGRTVREFDIELADGEPDFWVFSDVSRFRGRTLTIEVDRLPSDSQGLASIVQADEVPGADSLYREKLRPQFHFTSRRGWNNDPNGMVYSDGEYHLFYQHNPYGIKWGNMHWGHAVSRDMIHWEELPVAIYPHRFGDWVFSGGGTTDPHNTAGFQTGDEEVIIASYTSTGRGECIAYSNDGGRTFREFEGNPVVTHRGRDPKIVWYEPQKKWVMIVFDEPRGEWRYALYESKDLKHWQYLSAIPGFHECPELFEMPVDGHQDNKKWVVYGAERRDEKGRRRVARSSYMVGSFDGHTFTPETGILGGHLGPNYYAAQTFSGAPNGRRVMMGWLSGAVYPNMPFSQGMTVPLELSLRTTPDGLRLFFYPVKELESLRQEAHLARGLTIERADAMLKDIDAELLDLAIAFEPRGGELRLDVRGVPILYHGPEQTLSFRNKTARLGPIGGKIHLRVLIDRSVIEVFGNKGRAALSAGGELFSEEQPDIRLSGDRAGAIDLEVYELQSIWR